MKKQWEIAVASNRWKDLISLEYWENKTTLKQTYNPENKLLFNLVVLLIDLIELSIPFALFFYYNLFLPYHQVILSIEKVAAIILYIVVFALIFFILFIHWKLPKALRYWGSIAWLFLIIFLLTSYEVTSVSFLIVFLYIYIGILILFYCTFIKKKIKPQVSIEFNDQNQESKIKKDFYFKPNSYKKISTLLIDNGKNAEKQFYDDYLTKAVQGLHIDIFIKVGLKDLVEINDYVVDKKYRDAYFRKISQKHIDFILCDKSTQEILMAIEYDGYRHRTDDSIKKSDKEQDRICEVAGLPLLRVASDEPITVEILRERIISYIGLRCADCGKSITAGIANYCQLNLDRFKGNNYCMECQKNY